MPPDRLSFGVPALDDLLGGGLDTDSVTEVYGEGGSGKSVLCLHLTGRVALAGKWVLYVDTEGVSLERLEASAGPRLPEALQRILLARAHSLAEQDRAVAKAAALARDGKRPVGLVVVDSIAFFYRLAAAGEDADEGRESLLGELAELVSVAADAQVPAVFTNQVWRNQRDGSLEPLGGSFVNHAAKTILRMDRLEDDRRRIVLVKHRSRPPGAAPIRITSMGLEPG
ncbi:MAG: DNA repair and recombination protein RadB [Thermoplasmata archaeon]|jgi:DNA repair protein RadB|nr:DNA repair and recombination protein RadB [Thermoplasmata archaeon]